MDKTPMAIATDHRLPTTRTRLPLNSIELARESCIFGARSTSGCRQAVLDSCIFVKSACILTDVLSYSPLFSYTSPEVPSFLTSL